MDRTLPRASFVAGDWMDRFEMLANNLELAQTPIQIGINSTNIARLVAGVAAVVFSLAGLIQNRGSFYLMGVVCAVGALIFHGLNLRAQLLDRTRQLAPLPNLDGIAEGLNALTEFKIELCTKAFHGINVRNFSNPQKLFSKALDQWSAFFNEERTDITELNQIESLLETSVIVSSKEVQNYRRILPAARKIIASNLPIKCDMQLHVIWDAAFRFVNGSDNVGQKRSYVNLTINNAKVIEAREWIPFPKPPLPKDQ